MRNARQLIPLSLLCAVCAGHAAEPQIRPGLWEITASSNMLALVEQIPPEQRQQLGNLARQYGFVMPDIKDGAVVSQVCVTPEMAAQNIPPTSYHSQSGCEARNIKQNGRLLSAELVCNGAQIHGAGWVEATLIDSNRFTGKSAFKGTVHGIAVDEQVTTDGHWTDKECAPSDGS